MEYLRAKKRDGLGLRDFERWDEHPIGRFWDGVCFRFTFDKM